MRKLDLYSAQTSYFTKPSCSTLSLYRLAKIYRELDADTTLIPHVASDHKIEFFQLNYWSNVARFLYVYSIRTQRFMIRSVELLIDRRLMFCDTNNLDGTYANAKKIKDTYFGYSSSPPSVWFIVLYPNFYNQIYYSYYIQLLFFVNYKRTREVIGRNHIQCENIS